MILILTVLKYEAMVTIKETLYNKGKSTTFHALKGLTFEIEDGVIVG